MAKSIVVIGSGAAGLPAALAAATGGADVVVYESAPTIGGALAMSGGGMWMPNSSLMSPEWGEDSPGRVLDYLKRLTLGFVPEANLQAFVETAPEALDFFRDNVPVDFRIAGTPDYQLEIEGATRGGRQLTVGLYDRNRLGQHNQLLRTVPENGIPSLTHEEGLREGFGFGTGPEADALRALAVERVASGIATRGNALAGALFEACLRAGVTFVTDARVSEIDMNKGRVAGVKITRDGITTRVGARAVIIASGGFEWNRAMWNQLVGVPLDGCITPPWSLGDGLNIAIQAGARLAALDTVSWCPGVHVPGDEVDGKPAFRYFYASKAMPGAIAVNSSGRRFANESMNYHDFGQAMAAFDPHTYTFPNDPTWIVMDEEHVSRWRFLERDFGTEFLRSASSLEALASDIGVNPEGLASQVQVFNEHAADGRDPHFHREHATADSYRADAEFQGPPIRPLKSGRFYAYRQLLTCISSRGGAVTNGDAQVLDRLSSPIPGLFAAGNAAASVFGRSYPGGGATIGPAVTFGYAAGRTAARQ